MLIRVGVLLKHYSCGDKRVSEIIIEMTGGRADYCFECVGKASLELELDKFVMHEIGFKDINKAFDLLLE
ncbi:alcohol dehydrogenase-like 5 [Phtheirospermum japonicum]|uniref:Alcohol dehydrogenase-like 5 n=1 Tax=Phtheirospermum japonicum TaxID=374723 RepID=A0A830BMP0_9LAMI|nr:alcohol dehydrogenase-like 5 [Phtheirospermum japonicum]